MKRMKSGKVLNLIGRKDHGGIHVVKEDMQTGGVTKECVLG